jgi:hypothetical protein
MTGILLGREKAGPYSRLRPTQTLLRCVCL